MSNAALDKAVALSDAMIWLEVRSEGQALTIIDHINQQAERIAELEGGNAALVVDRQHYIERLAAAEKLLERDALRAENERLKAWRTWGKNVARALKDVIDEHSPYGVHGFPDASSSSPSSWERALAACNAMASAPKESPQIPDGSPDAWVPRS